jgi:hypothetical protein
MNITAITRLVSTFCLTTACALSALVAISGHADTYRWIDDNGVVNYAERVPRDVPAERVTKVAEGKQKREATSERASTPPEESDNNASPGALRTSQQPLNENQQNLLNGLQAAEQARQEQIAKLRQDNCDRSRRVLNNLSINSRIRVRADDGSERVLDEDERQERIAAAQRGVAANCEA